MPATGGPACRSTTIRQAFRWRSQWLAVTFSRTMKLARNQAKETLYLNRNFRLLFTAQVISLTGSGVTTVALALFAHQMVGGPSSAAVIGTALMLRILAFLIFSQPAGVLADRVDRKRLLIASDLIRFALLGAFPFVQEIWQIYVLIFLINAATSFFTPTYDATVPEVVGQDRIVKALSISRLTSDMEAIFSPMLAALLISLMELKWLFWFDAFTYLVSAVMVAEVRLKPIQAPQGKPTVSQRLIAEITYGTRVLLMEPSLRRSLILSFASAVAGAAAIVGTVIYIHDDLNLGGTEFTLSMTALGLGSSLMAIMLGKATGRYESFARRPSELHGRRHRWSDQAMLVGGVLLGVLLLSAYRHPSYLPFMGLWFLNGVGQALIDISASTLLAEHTRPANRGRAYAAHFALTHAFWLISYPAIGYGIQGWGSVITFSMAGAVCLVLSLMALVTRKPQRDHVHV